MLAAAMVLPLVPAGWRRGEPDLGTLLDRVVAAGAPGVRVVVRGNGKVHGDARGFPDRSRSIRMRDDERFRIALLLLRA